MGGSVSSRPDDPERERRQRWEAPVPFSADTV
jgi:hypothetical protein